MLDGTWEHFRVIVDEGEVFSGRDRCCQLPRGATADVRFQELQVVPGTKRRQLISYRRFGAIVDYQQTEGHTDVADDRLDTGFGLLDAIPGEDDDRHPGLAFGFGNPTQALATELQ